MFAQGAVVGMTLPLAREFGDDGIRINTIAPGLFNTPLLASLPPKVCLVSVLTSSVHLSYILTVVTENKLSFLMISFPGAQVPVRPGAESEETRRPCRVWRPRAAHHPGIKQAKSCKCLERSEITPTMTILQNAYMNGEVVRLDGGIRMPP